MVRPSRKKSPSFTIPPNVAIIAAIILGISYAGTEAYKHHNSYHDIDGSWQVCFTPNQQCQQLIIQQINEAKQSILGQAYSFTDDDIIEALIKAQKRGVNVSLILDHSNLTSKHSGLNKILSSKIPVRIDKPQGIAHNKLMIIDEHIIIGGSYNYSKGAYQRNAENIMIIHDKPLATEYINNWQKRWTLSHLPSKVETNKPKPQSTQKD